ncbi:MAG: hypothetical protein JXR03_20740 [Cyclobacteriaceae bacterium]
MKAPFLATLIIPLCISCSYWDSESGSLSSELSDISERLNPTQTFKILPIKDTLLAGNLGTKIFIKANSLIMEDGEPATGSVTVKLKEVYSISDMILNGLSTTSDGKLLTTSGMINLAATSKGENLKLNHELPIKIQFKKVADAPSMRTYLAIEDSVGIDWQLDKKNINDTVRFVTTKQYVRTLSDEGDEVGVLKVEYGIVAKDTFELARYFVRSLWSDRSIELDSAVIDNHLSHYEIHSTQLNWINCDYFIPNDANITIFVEKLDDSETQTFLIFSGLNAIMRSWEYDNISTTFKNIPLGSEATILSIAKTETGHFFFMQKRNLSEDLEEIVPKYKKMSIDKISDQLKKLDINLE